MKVSGAGGAGGAAGAGRARPTSGGEGFRLPAAAGAGAAGPVGQATGVSALAGMGAILALQETGGALERRRRAVRRADRILDVLDEVKIALIDGQLSLAQLDRLTRAVKDQRDQTEDAALEAILDEIETRAAVELAKLEMARSAVTRVAG